MYGSLYQNPSKLKIEPLSQYDILKKDFRDRKVEQTVTNALSGKSTIILKFIDFKVDKNRSDDMFDYFFIEIEQEDDSKFWSKESFSFDDIIAMRFL